MNGRQPQRISELLVTLLDTGGLEDLAALYEDHAIFADYDTTVSGLDAITEAHRRFRDAGKTLRLNESTVFEADDIALVHWSWTVHDVDGSSRSGISAEVLRRQSDGAWKFIIDKSNCAALGNSD